MIEQVFFICALLPYAPYYDCSEQWGIVIYDDWVFQSLSTGKLVTGYTVNRDHDYEFMLNGKLWKMPKKFVGIGKINYDNCYDGKCRSVLTHELKHLMCSCDWHENQISKPLLAYNLN